MPKDLRGGTPTYWTKFGQGDRPALLLHCSLAHSGAWAGVAAELDDMLAMTAFDLPGHGRSADWQEGVEMQGQSLDMALDLMDGPADLIGHSFGATVALRMAVERPEMVKSLTLIEPPYVAVIKADHPGIELDDDHVMARFDRLLDAGDREQAARVFTEAWGDGRPWEALRAETRAAMVDRIHLIQANNPALRDDVAHMLRPGVLEAVSVPVLLIEGGDSPAEVAMIQDGLERRLPDTRRVVFEGAGHMVALTHAKQVGAEIRKFLEEIA